ncbi:hypothetical protein ANCCEY_05974 [Ancylostoma ceylanicum]|uniref:Uncharacterized protein n=1 Tax=Ancylostoma ceylanicum TaxID=53326 RepID=A0A0D6M4T6_9BILA|nr:hypothetical protein ANCCEY_05974 [Ancylostoma ceylanicum]
MCMPLWRSDKITEVDLFLENCSSLYNLILDALHDLSSKSTLSVALSELPFFFGNRGHPFNAAHQQLI